VTESEYWDERYSVADQLWSGAPNSVLVDVAAALPAGRALDVGCGEGADAVWLAKRGWLVDALDVSGVALARAAAHGRDAGVDIRWIHSGLVEAEPDLGRYDLVSAQYPVLAKTPDAVAERVLIDAVAPDGLLVVVHHAEFASDHDHDGHAGDFDPADYVGPWDVRPLLGDGWVIELDETRPRHLTTGSGAGHTSDAVLVARNLSQSRSAM
jgi:SAM-dependent methyltransferase